MAIPGGSGGSAATWRRGRCAAALAVACVLVRLALAPLLLCPAPPLPRHLRPRFSLRAEPESTGPSPEAWRDFRAQLIAGGIKVTGDSGEAAGVGEAEAEDGGGSSEVQQRRAVAPRNEALLKEQNEALWNEYMTGAWAHRSIVEAGGLLCRIPVPAQLVFMMRREDLRKSHWGAELHKRLLKELPEATADRSKESIFESWAANTNFCYRLAENLVQEVLEAITQKATNGRLDVTSLSQGERRMVILYHEAHDEWQSVCLVLNATSASDAGEAVTINRPLGRSMDRQLAARLLNGARAAPDGEAGVVSDRVVQRCVKAFGQEAGVYLGGPELQEERGLCIHGFSGLAGAVELAPGTGIYVGGEEAAIDGVLDGKFSPLDFRWFLGRHTDLSTSLGAWSAVACARPIALKQCLGLPKPLWHEVLELCGGESAELSRLEYIKRDDLEDD